MRSVDQMPVFAGKKKQALLNGTVTRVCVQSWSNTAVREVDEIVPNNS
jgi:hypothetical protein